MAVKRTSRNSAKLSIDVYDTKGKVVEEMDLPKEIFGVSINPTLLSQAVRVYLANQKRGTSSTKTRGEVKGSTRKIWRQKGTGRARHGSIRAGIFVHGGVVFGPKPRDNSLSLSKKMRRKALFSSLSEKFRGGNIRVLSGFEKLKPKTKEMAKTLRQLNLVPKESRVLLVVPNGSKESENVKIASRNIEGVDIVSSYQLNTYDVLKNPVVLFMKQSIQSMQDHFLGRS